jgi:riboflavin synthase
LFFRDGGSDKDMFTGIIESLGLIIGKTQQLENIEFEIRSDIARELKVDQSVSHNGVCLTVTEVNNDTYKVTAIKETLNKTMFSDLLKGEYVNLERSMILNGRLDGHIVQGHVDQTAICYERIENNGSWIFSFKYENKGNITVEKGSICVNGVSLTVVNSKNGSFSVAVIPYTFNNTNFKYLNSGQKVNLEFDIIGKYIVSLVNKSQ